MINPMKKLTFLNREKAQTMVEFAIVFPIVLLITYGIIEFGRMMFIYASVTGAARDGARYGAAVGAVNGTKYYKDCAGIRDATRIGAILIPITDSDITIWYDNGPQSGHTVWSGCPPVDSTGQDPITLGDRIVVHVEVSYKPIINFLGLSEKDCSSSPKGPFCFVSENARTILVDVKMIRPIPYP